MCCRSAGFGLRLIWVRNQAFQFTSWVTQGEILALFLANGDNDTYYLRLMEE